MVNNIDEFSKTVKGFDRMTQSKVMDCFAYYISVHLKQDFSIKDIEKCFTELSLPPYSNIRQYLSENSDRNAKPLQKFIKTEKGFVLNRKFKEELDKIITTDELKFVVSNSLRSLLAEVKKSNENNYLAEAIKTFEIEAYRASIIMVWLLTIDHLYEYILSEKGRLDAFILALRSMNNRTSINSKDDFGELKEMIFLQACKNAGIISNDVWKILDVKLGIRNSVAHPSTIILGKTKALDFIEDLINNVVIKYKIE